jgi:hypothetical protein
VTAVELRERRGLAGRGPDELGVGALGGVV